MDETQCTYNCYNSTSRPSAALRGLHSVGKSTQAVISTHVDRQVVIRLVAMAASVAHIAKTSADEPIDQSDCTATLVDPNMENV